MRTGIVVPVVLGFLMFEGVALARNPGHAMTSSVERRVERSRAMEPRAERSEPAMARSDRTERVARAAAHHDSLSAWRGAKYSEMPGAPGSPRNRRNAQGATPARAATKATLYNDIAKRAELGQAPSDEAVTDAGTPTPNDAEPAAETNAASA